ncbi:hypothetical protein Taro_004067 [Colocasia esculenta]|uniref:Uncharacterized protein n=1 Tax=Colocasia esculenta TaxID=4460 RepID=A0A843TQN5_COLES|nr:hypothetical protein [Colocasia esculenta]
MEEIMESSKSASDRKGKGVTEPRYSSVTGAVAELVRIGGTAGHALLSIVCGRTSESVARVDSGDYSVVLIVRSGTNPLCLLSCVVGEHQWPLSRDSPVLRVGPRRFSFAFPGFFYGLTLPEGCFDEDVRKLEVILHTFCSYENHARERGARSGIDFWASSYAKIKKLTFGPAQSATLRGRSGNPPLPTVQRGPREKATLMWQRALRTSAATKLVAKVLFGDAVDPDLHVEFTVPGAAATTSASGSYVIARLRAITDVVDAVEAARGVGMGSWSMAPCHWAPAIILPDGAMHWHFNMRGLTLVLRALAAVAAEPNADGVQEGRGAEEGGSSLLGGQAGGGSMEENRRQV